MFFKKKKTNKLQKIYVSVMPKSKGGGINTFSYNLIRWLKAGKYIYEKNILKADKAIIIANKVDFDLLKQAKNNGCYIIHRLDEHFEENESGFRKQKHDEIIEINKYSDITVYQSNFVFDNVHKYLSPKKYTIIMNGGDKKTFFPSKVPGKYIGHVSWSYHKKKRLDLLYHHIKKHTEEKFLLVGNQKLSEYAFGSMKNVTLAGPIKRNNLRKYFNKMKLLYFPSENDPCPNTVVESILSGVPVCYNELGGTKEIVKDSGLSLNQFDELLENCEYYREKCVSRNDLCFDVVAKRYLSL